MVNNTFGFLYLLGHFLVFSFLWTVLVLFMCAWSIVFVIICLTLFVPFIWDLSFVSCFVFSFPVFVLIPFNAITSDLWNCSLTSVGPEPLEWKC